MLFDQDLLTVHTQKKCSSFWKKTKNNENPPCPFQPKKMLQKQPPPTTSQFSQQRSKNTISPSATANQPSLSTSRCAEAIQRGGWLSAKSSSTNTKTKASKSLGSLATSSRNRIRRAPRKPHMSRVADSRPNSP